jgi:hypothetical protein
VNIFRYAGRLSYQYKHAKKQIVLLIEGGGKRAEGQPTLSRSNLICYDDLRAEFEALVAMAYGDNDELDMLKETYAEFVRR